jgi:hypothetical protein
MLIPEEINFSKDLFCVPKREGLWYNTISTPRFAGLASSAVAMPLEAVAEDFMRVRK